MASPLNKFISVAADVTTTPTYIYTCPSETTAIVLLAQASNIDSTNIANVTFYTSLNSNTELVKDFTIPTGDSAGLISGKLVVEEGDSIGAYCDSNNTLKITLSILETK